MTVGSKLPPSSLNSLSIPRNLGSLSTRPFFHQWVLQLVAFGKARVAWHHHVCIVLWCTKKPQHVEFEHCQGSLFDKWYYISFPIFSKMVSTTFITVPFRLIRPGVWPVTRWTKFRLCPMLVWPGTRSKIRPTTETEGGSSKVWSGNVGEKSLIVVKNEWLGQFRDLITHWWQLIIEERREDQILQQFPSIILLYFSIGTSSIFLIDQSVSSLNR